MPPIEWDKDGERLYETGVDHGVLYPINDAGVYAGGVAWNGLTAVTESPSGAEANKIYADNRVYLNLVSAEEFGGTIEAYMYPDEFAACDGTAELAPGVTIGQQRRRTFGLSYRTLIGSDLDSELGYKLHLVYGALAAPTEKANNSVNDTPEPNTFSWEFTTTPVVVPGHKATSILTIDSTKVAAAKLTAIEDLIYGKGATLAALPKPVDIITILAEGV